MTYNEYIYEVKRSKKYRNCCSKYERKRILDDANKTWKRRMKKYEERKELEQDLENIKEEAYLEGYYDALLEMNEDYSVLNEVHLSSYAKDYRKATRESEEHARKKNEKKN
jgi:hypothetical protein